MLRKLLEPRGPQPTLSEAIRLMDERVNRLRNGTVKWARLLTPLLFLAALVVGLAGPFVDVGRAVPFGAGIVALLALVPTAVDAREQIIGQRTYRDWLRKKTEPMVRAVRMRMLRRLFRLYGQYEVARRVQSDAAGWFAPKWEIYRRRRRVLVLAVVILCGAGLSAWRLWPVSGTTDIVPGREFALGPKLKVTIHEMSCQAGDGQSTQPDTCSVRADFRNAGHDPYFVAPGSFGVITSSGPMFDGGTFASGMTIGGDFYYYDAGLSRVASPDLSPGARTTATLVYDIDHEKVTTTSSAGVKLLFTAYPGKAATRVAVPPPGTGQDKPR